MKAHPGRSEYCQYLLVSQMNHTLTDDPEHPQALSHEHISLRFIKISGQEV